MFIRTFYVTVEFSYFYWNGTEYILVIGADVQEKKQQLHKLTLTIICKTIKESSDASTNKVMAFQKDCMHG